MPDTQNLFLNIFLCREEVTAKCTLLLIGSFMVGDNKAKKRVSMKLIASLDPVRAEVEAGAVAKADQ